MAQILTPNVEFNFYQAGEDGREKSFIAIPKRLTKGFARSVNFTKMVAFGRVAEELNELSKGGTLKVGCEKAVTRRNQYGDTEVVAIMLESGTFDPLYADRLGMEEAEEPSEDEIPI